MSDTDGDVRRQTRPERERGRSTRWFVVGASLFLVLGNVLRLGASGDSGVIWGTAALCAVIVAFSIAMNKKVAGGLKALASRDELSEAVDSAKGMRRMNLVWYEYVIARNVARGTYHDEPPANFKSDVYDASMRMGMATRYSTRQVGWLSLFFAVLALVIPFMVAGDDVGFVLLMSAVLIVIFALSIGVTLLFIRWRSRSPLSRLGRRVEDAADLDGDARWLELLEIAREEATL